MSLSAAAVFAPYVRLELLQWDPVFTGQAGAPPTQRTLFLSPLPKLMRTAGTHCLRCLAVCWIQSADLPAIAICKEPQSLPGHIAHDAAQCSGRYGNSQSPGQRLRLRAGFDDQQWYRQLYDYGMGASFGPEDADEELIPRLVRELVLPLAQHALQAVWNPASRRQSRAAAAVVADLLVYVPPDDPKMQVSTPLP